MLLAADITRKIDKLFAPAERQQAAALVVGATLHDGSKAGLRCQRCAVQASAGSLSSLSYYLDLMKIDFRDVIVAGEYEHCDGNLVRVRDLNEPFDQIAPA